MNCFNIGRSELLKTLNTLKPSCAKRPAQPILECVYICSSDEDLKMSVNNLQYSVTKTIRPTSLDGEFSFCINLERFIETISSIPASIENLELNVKDSKVTVLLGEAKTVFNTLTPESFPLPKTPSEDVKSFSISSDELLNAIRDTKYSAEQRDKVGILSGICMEVTQDSVCFASTDGNRLSYVELKNTDKTFISEDSTPVSISIPKAFCDIMVKLLEQNQQVKVSLDKTLGIFIEMDTVVAHSYLLTGQYPKYRQLIPSQGTTSIAFVKSEMLNWLKFTSTTTSERSRMVIFNLSNGLMSLKTRNTDSAESVATMSYSGDTGSLEGVPFAFNINFLQEAIQHLDSNIIIMYTNGANQPFVFKKDSSDDASLALVMPTLIK